MPPVRRGICAFERLRQRLRRSIDLQGTGGLKMRDCAFDDDAACKPHYG